MPPRRFKKKYVKRLVEKHVAKAIKEYEKTSADSNNAGGSGSANTRETIAPEVQGCSYKTFMNGKPHFFNRTEGVVGLKRWFEKIEQVFEIRKFNEDDNVKFVVCMFEGRALTWAYAVAPAEGRGYAGNLPRCNHCNSYHNGQCPPKYRKYQRTGHQEKDYRTRVPGARVTPLRMQLVMDTIRKGITRTSVPRPYGVISGRELRGYQ
ncbi:hypothetical protein Tco_0625183 [Tanacetum coccineum]|uniref:Retrotransposon gag domain-containing protein n=1 Tax=Tanacetum coccineum TaxID=301880 RepID=A0ABQ4WG41_9ASTR